MIFNKMSAAILFALPVLASATQSQPNPKNLSEFPQTMVTAVVAAPSAKHALPKKAVAVGMIKLGGCVRPCV